MRKVPERLDASRLTCFHGPPRQAECKPQEFRLHLLWQVIQEMRSKPHVRVPRSGATVVAVEDAALACIYVRDRVCVPLDMTIWAAKRFRWALTETAKLQGYDESRVKRVIVEKRLDQFPGPFSGDTQVLPDGMKEIKKFKEGTTPELIKGGARKKATAKTTKTKKR